ncbi:MULTISPECIES: mechanosensitive ion channel family protein [unclassified Microcoleus]|uniref:mechanosensitive ion channel family protein n=1 Tax=unclassified Microcoleus TaxID=2642155 RepID=UPI002FD51D31
MGVVIQQIQTSLLNLLGQAIEAMPSIAAALAVILLTRTAARFVRRMSSAASQLTVKSLSLRSLTSANCLYPDLGDRPFDRLRDRPFPALRPGDIIGLLGLSSVAVSFAFQDIFKNFLAGILMLLHEPFQLGDQIIVEGFEGTVEEISMRSTQILTYQGERVIVPNAIVFTNSVRVLTAMPHRRTDLPLILDYDTEPSLAIETLVQAISEVEGVFSQPTPEVDISGLNDGYLHLIVRYWTLPEQAQVRRTKTRAVVAIKAACDRADIRIPQPVPVKLYDLRSSNNSASNSASDA